MRRLDTISPIRIFVIVLTVVFTVETAIMFVVERIDVTRDSRAIIALLDALTLVAALSPVLWLLVVRPLRATIAERGAMLARTLRAQEEERARLARDLHDELGQVQFAILLGARSVVNAQTLADAQTRAAEVARMASESIESSRRIASGLAPGVLIDLGLAVAAERLCEDIALASGLSIEHTIALGPERLARETEFAAYRVLQEALTNCVKHARAAHVRVTLDATDDMLRLSVADDGSGIAPNLDANHGDGFGLRSMRERILLRNGAFSVVSSPMRGTTVTATLPVVHDSSTS
ncbi:MAG: sensor histidine kinase [Phycisphaerae bacterium]|nr:sensor histidine kinase [Phycisphaerae bacterium]